MTKRRYIDKVFQEQTLSVILQAEQIIIEYQQQGYGLTLRQLYYQFVARDLMENKQANYNRLGGIISDARLAGLISWTAIEDRTRNLRGVQTYNDPSEAVAEVGNAYHLDLWANQPYRPEVWIEKEALSGVIQGICETLRVDYFACRGYNSQSEQWRAGQRMAGYVRQGQRPMVFHLGDHDPSGLDMTRDNRERLSLFAGVPVTVQRLALNMPQIEELRPPPNPAKITDSRYDEYCKRFGTDQSWELDALPPDTVAKLINDAVSSLRDEARWREALEQEVDDRRAISEVSDELVAQELKKMGPGA